MFCPNCKNEIRDGESFCNNCGINVKDFVNNYGAAPQAQQPGYNYFDQPEQNPPSDPEYVQQSGNINVDSQVYDSYEQQPAVQNQNFSGGYYQNAPDPVQYNYPAPPMPTPPYPPKNDKTKNGNQTVNIFLSVALIIVLAAGVVIFLIRNPLKPSTNGNVDQQESNITVSTTSPTPTISENSTPAEILAYYNESINKVKPNATSVVRNYQDIVHNAEYLEVPSLLKKAGESLIGQFVKGNFDPVTYSTKEEIIANFPVHDETYSSMATVDDITRAECIDDGTYYNITLVFATSVDPANGVGVGSAFNCMKSDDVMDAAGFVVESFSVEYYDCKIECRIDKATGNTVKATFTCNELMSVAAKGNLKAKVGLTFIDDYTINY